MRPNILLVLVDSARVDAYDINGGPAHAPALARLAAGGVNARRCWSTVPICHPSRASIITGRFPYAHGMLTNGPAAGGWPFRVQADAHPLPSLLREAGYRTGYAGQEHIVIPGWDDDRHQPTYAYRRWLAQRGFEEAAREGDRYWHCGTLPFDIDHTREGQFAARGLELLDDLCAGEQPWFMQLDFDGPHPPCLVPERFAAMYEPDTVDLPDSLHQDMSDRPDWLRMARRRQGGEGRPELDWRRLRAYYYANITMLDELLGRILDRLDTLGAADDTIVVFTSDHAAPVGEHGFAGHGGPALYEGTLRVPCVVRWPAGLPAGTVCDAALQHVDLVPTLLDLADVDADTTFHGRSLAPALRGEPHDVPDDDYHVYSGNGRSFFSVRAYRRGDWKLAYAPFGGAELYDLGNDPGERNNLAGRPEHADAERAIRAGMAEAMERYADPLLAQVKGDLVG